MYFFLYLIYSISDHSPYYYHVIICPTLPALARLSVTPLQNPYELHIIFDTIAL